MKKELTPEQLDALIQFAKYNGRRWKTALNHCWCEGCYRMYGARDIDAPLQQVRNQFGPSWLLRFKLPK